MKKRTIHFLIGSLIILIIVCTSVLSVFAITMSKKSERAINEVGTIYMSGMSERISMHFETTINLRLAQVETMIKNISPSQHQKYSKSLVEKLESDGKNRSFDYLALMRSDGILEMIYGDEIKLIDPQPFLDSMNNDEKKVAVGNTASGKKIVVMGVSVSYPMSDNQTSTALVAGMPVEYINEILSLDDSASNALTHSHIIRRDGSYVIRNFNAYRNNYFTRLREIVSESSEKKPEDYVNELQNAIKNNEDYSTIMIAENERRHIYCTHLPYSEWYLITAMPYNTLDETVNNLSDERLNILFAGIGVILLTLTIIFAKYFRMTQHQIRELNTARKTAENATKAKSEFLSNMSHDIRTPMNAIVGMTAIATANIDNKQQVHTCLKKISLSSKHLLGLINDILDMSKIESGKMTLNMDQISLREVMDSIVNIVQPQIKAKKQHFDVFIQDIEVENVYCDGVRLNQILLNFLSNAIKFTPEGGIIQTSLYEEESPKGENYIRVHLIVKDNGIGMTPEFQQKIFESFVREDNKRIHKTEGSGLGMAITKHIIDAMDGTIELQSEPDNGTEFHVTLDLEKAFVTEEDMILPEWNILVVDDDEQLCKSTVSSIKTIGMKADWTLDGETAIKMITERYKKFNEYQIILLDWKLPGIDGIETARQIRKQLGDDVPILLISAYDWSEIESDAREAGINGFISKPLFKSTLYYGLKQYMVDDNNSASENITDNKSDFKGAKVLVAEDNELNWEIAYELLSELGLDMEHAEDGKICCDKFKASSEGYYSAILMDIRMPVMNGYEATETIRALNRSDSDIPIIAMTADAFSEDIKKCLESGMNAHIAKPIDIKEVARLLDKYLN